MSTRGEKVKLEQVTETEKEFKHILTGCEWCGHTFLIKNVGWKELVSSLRKRLVEMGAVDLNECGAYEGDALYFYEPNGFGFEFTQSTLYAGNYGGGYIGDDEYVSGRSYPFIRFVKGDKRSGHLVITYSRKGLKCKKEDFAWRGLHLLDALGFIGGGNATLKVATEEEINKVISLYK